MRRLLTLSLVLLGGRAAATDKPLDFNRDVRPILTDKCFACHGPDPKHRKAKLRLDTREGAHESAVVRGKPAESELVARITAADDTVMPPKKGGKPLTPAEIEVLKRWVKEGATYTQHWAYVPPKKLPPPAVKDAAWPANWVDPFILARLEKEGLAPSPDADRRTLIRRLSFDLTGLPPTPAEVDAFVADKDPKAYEKLVDRLLASEHYGERMAVYWLHPGRYAGTVRHPGHHDH